MTIAQDCRGLTMPELADRWGAPEALIYLMLARTGLKPSHELFEADTLISFADILRYEADAGWHRRACGERGERCGGGSIFQRRCGATAAQRLARAAKIIPSANMESVEMLRAAWEAARTVRVAA